MDSDDVADRHRLKNQLTFLKNNPQCDVLGGMIAEFLPGIPHKHRSRVVPLAHDEIVRVGRFRQPLNHVTLMFTKNIYERSGGYGFFRVVEDYDFYHRLWICGAVFASIPTVLVRVNAPSLSRRSGLAYFREEFLLQLLMYKSRYISLKTLLRNVLVRLVFRVSPGWLQSFLMNFLRSKS